MQMCRGPKSLKLPGLYLGASIELSSADDLPRLAIRPEPFDEQPRAVFDGGIWPESDRAFQIRTIGTGLEHVAGLHRQEFADGRTADSLLDQPNEFDHLDRAAIADVIEAPRRTACRRIGRIARPGRDLARAGA